MLLSILAAFLPLWPCAQEDALVEVNRLSREIDARLGEARGDGNLLTVVQALRAMEEEYAASGGMALEVLHLHLMTRSAELGDYAAALRYGDGSPGPTAVPARELPEELGQATRVDALDRIEDLAQDHLLVLINEAHHVPQHRAFTQQLMRRLREQGFTHFAAETLSDTDPGLVERGYPTAATGYYIEEPLYADLVRTALELGYEVVPYESKSGDREEGQARNLIERTLDLHEDARVLVHAGYAHIHELGSVAGSRAMAGRVKEITGIDPLTIDQTAFTEHSAPGFEDPLYGELLETHAITAPSLLLTASGEPWSAAPGVVDISLVHPRSVYEGGRPSWLRMGGLRQPVPLPDGVCGDEARVLVRAMVRGEGAAAIPIDQVEVSAGATPPVLMLPEGEFVIEVWSASNVRLSTTTAKRP